MTEQAKHDPPDIKNVDLMIRWHSELRTFLDTAGKSLSLDEAGVDGLSPLHLAIRDQRVDCVELLVTRGAQVARTQPSTVVHSPTSGKQTSLESVGQALYPFKTNQSPISKTPLEYLWSEDLSAWEILMFAIELGLVLKMYPEERLQVTTEPGRLPHRHHSYLLSQFGQKEMTPYEQAVSENCLTWIHIQDTIVRSRPQLSTIKSTCIY